MSEGLSMSASGQKSKIKGRKAGISALAATYAMLAMMICGCTTGKNAITGKHMKQDKIRSASVAGQFYPAGREALAEQVNKLLGGDGEIKRVAGLEAKALMVPHAGYAYSGQVAAYAYQALAGRKIGTVVLLCNSHTARFSGAAVDDSDAWETPLGTVEIDQVLANRLLEATDELKYDSKAHSSDHTLEVQLPFLQVVLGEGFRIVPILFGNAGGDAYSEVARAIAENIGENDLIVASSDMSHYPNYADARRIDAGTLETIASGSPEDLQSTVEAAEAAGIEGEVTALCGIEGVKAMVAVADRLGWSERRVLHYANSGDIVHGDRERVVGYGAIIVGKNEDQKSKIEKQDSQGDDYRNNGLSEAQKRILMQIARDSVAGFVKHGKAPEFTIGDPRLNERQGAFVTLKAGGKLRGCIGQIVPGEEPLWQVVRDMAVAAASEDQRFSPIRESELSGLGYEVSVLSVPARITNYKEIELGRHGVIVRKGSRSGVFLPQVAEETGWSKEKFMEELCSQKAGLADNAYKDDPGVELLVFTADVF